MNFNEKRLEELRAKERVPSCHLGELVTDIFGTQGRVDAIYIDLAAAIDALATVRDGWYEGLEYEPKTPKDGGPWYSVILDDGSVLVGELDIRRR